MDSDNKNGNSGGAIFSENTENTDTTSGVISNGVATDAQQAGLRHSFSAHRPTKILTNVPGDVVLANAEKSKKSKTPVIIFIISIFVALAIAGVYFLPKLINSPSSYSFNRYANYLLYGNDADAVISEQFNSDATYEVQAQLGAENNESRKAYFEKLNELFAGIASDSSEEYSFQHKLLDAITLLADTSDPGFEEISAYYVLHGKELTEDYYRDFYRQFAEIEYYAINDYGIAASERIANMIAILDMYNQHNCFADGALQSSCVEDGVVLSDTMSYYDEYYRLNSLLDSLRNAMLDNITSDCYKIITESESK